MKYIQKGGTFQVCEAILIDHNPDEINNLFPKLIYAFEDRDGTTKAIICRLPKGKLKTVSDGVYLVKNSTSETLTTCDKEQFEKTYERVEE